MHRFFFARQVEQIQNYAWNWNERELSLFKTVLGQFRIRRKNGKNRKHYCVSTTEKIKLSNSKLCDWPIIWLFHILSEKLELFSGFSDLVFVKKKSKKTSWVKKPEPQVKDHYIHTCKAEAQALANRLQKPEGRLRQLIMVFTVLASERSITTAPCVAFLCCCLHSNWVNMYRCTYITKFYFGIFYYFVFFSLQQIDCFVQNTPKNHVLVFKSTSRIKVTFKTSLLVQVYWYFRNKLLYWF